MRGRVTAQAGLSGAGPTNTPAGNRPPDSIESRAAAHCRRCRPIMSGAFWLDSAEGAMLPPHDSRSLVIFLGSLLAASAALADDLRARREGRHQDLFGPADCRAGRRWTSSRRRPTRRPPAPSVDRTRPPEEQSLHGSGEFPLPVRACTPRIDETFQNPVDRHAERGADSRAAPGRRGASSRSTAAQLPNRRRTPTERDAHAAGTRHAHRDRARHGSLRQAGVRCQHHVSRAAHRSDSPSAASAAAPAPPRPTPN